MIKIRYGIDPGKTGFICEWNDSRGTFEFFPIPKIGTEVDVKEIDNLFKERIARFGDYDIHCVIEDVHAVFGSSAKGTFEFGKIVGVLEALLYSNNIPFTKVQPKKWQKDMWEGIPIQKKPSSTGKTMTTDTKKMSYMAAKRLFPEVDLRKSTRAKNPDHNKVDALLITEYCRRKF